ncbi:MAG: Lrp/AsnC family transcriptional regulator [archaeon]|nr:MAG: Lrp/AsnC family transcriptional regulator [archaeon]
MGKIKLDLKDRKILYELDINARQTISEIAKKVKLNKNTVNYKIKKLENEKLILGYYTVVDYSKLGFISLRVYFNFFNTKPEHEKEIINFLIKNKKVGVVGQVESPYDIIFQAWVKNIYEFDDFWFKFKKKFRQFIWKERVYLVNRVYNFKRKYITDKPNYEYEFGGGSKKEKFDEFDLKILKLLARNARIPIIDIAEKLKVPERTIAYRIKQLEKKKIIMGYRLNLDAIKIGYEYYKLNCVLNSMEDYERLFQFSQQHPNVIFLDRTMSELDLEIDIEVRGRKEMLKLIKELKEKFKIRDIEIATYKEYYKLETIPQ